MNENLFVYYFDFELNNDFKIVDLFDEFLFKLYIYEYEDEIYEYDNLDFDVYIIDLNDFDVIKKEEVEKILISKNFLEIYRIFFFLI